MRQFMNATFKTNPALGRGLITGVTRVSRESIFSDLNNLAVVTTSRPKYQTCFGFTQDEVDAALAEYNLSEKRESVRDWYDGFVFGGVEHIYNPWSVTKFLEDGGLFDAYWANTSGNGLVSEVVRQGDEELKADFEELMRGGEVSKVIDEQVVFSELHTRPNAVWALLLAAGYVTSPGSVPEFVATTPRRLRITNKEIEITFDRMARGWFSPARVRYDQFAAPCSRATRAWRPDAWPRSRAPAFHRSTRAHTLPRRSPSASATALCWVCSPTSGAAGRWSPTVRAALGATTWRSCPPTAPAGPTRPW